jgi:hypothetical protein
MKIVGRNSKRIFDYEIDSENDDYVNIHVPNSKGDLVVIHFLRESLDEVCMTVKEYRKLKLEKLAKL